MKEPIDFFMMGASSVGLIALVVAAIVEHKTKAKIKAARNTGWNEGREYQIALTKPKQASLSLAIEQAGHSHQPTAETPAPANESPRKRVPYIPTNESPWCVLKMRNGKWVLAFSDLYDTRKDARKDATACQIALNCKTRVVRAIIPTR